MRCALILMLSAWSAFGQGWTLRDAPFVGAAQAVGPWTFSYSATKFDAGDYMSRGADLTGNADGKKGIISFWVKTHDLTGTRTVFATAPAAGIRVTHIGGFRLEGWNSSATQVLKYTSYEVAQDAWIHVLMTWDMDDTTSSRVYTNDVTARASYSTFTSGQTIDYTQSNFHVGQDGGGIAYFDGSLCEVYINLAETMDISNVTNRRKFIGADGKPVSLGQDGSLPTGTAPLIYLHGTYTGFNANSGTGGNFSAPVGGLTSDTAP